jgi:hypothetical protein
MKVRGFRRLASGAVLSAVLLLPSGCLSTEPLFALFWIGTFQPEPGAPVWVAGTLEMVANPSHTEVGVFLESVPGFTTEVSWHVRNGPCSGSGEPIAPTQTFPAVTLSEDGSGVGIASIRRRVGSGTYAGEIFSGPGGTGERLACADLTQS